MACCTTLLAAASVCARIGGEACTKTG